MLIKKTFGSSLQNRNVNQILKLLPCFAMCQRESIRHLKVINTELHFLGDPSHHQDLCFLILEHEMHGISLIINDLGRAWKAVSFIREMRVPDLDLEGFPHSEQSGKHADAPKGINGNYLEPEHPGDPRHFQIQRHFIMLSVFFLVFEILIQSMHAFVVSGSEILIYREHVECGVLAG